MWGHSGAQWGRLCGVWGNVYVEVTALHWGGVIETVRSFIWCVAGDPLVSHTVHILCSNVYAPCNIVAVYYSV